ncbi:hypothetical protein SAMN04488498_113102 [Mesorhizobium albiziae]|uniref:YARHG domain-containing protein n=1 Tax=Neomesorhizobium albiziae TaxID=335020 RepID=A0A1I4CLY5_9HYPH|nr:hypothetical protein [Mesorhizobium albiziae]SFK81259.1 hypothetical protein SAMN04488498_113102 [Mesorhizobium albiziae]
MKVFLFSTAIVFSTPSFAFDAQPVILQFYDASYACEAGENHDGEKISEDLVKKACADKANLTSRLAENGYCFKEHEWLPCT